MKKIWEKKGPNWDSIIEITLKDGVKIVGFYQGYSEDKEIMRISQTKTPIAKYRKLLTRVRRSNIKSGRVIKW